MARILVVDDDAQTRGYVYAILSKKYEVDAVASGQEAVRNLEENSYAVMITDVDMPGMDGVTLMRQARRMRPAPSVVLMSGGNRPSMSNGDEAPFIAKPFRAGELLNTVQGLLNADAGKPSS